MNGFFANRERPAMNAITKEKNVATRNMLMVVHAPWDR
jgi:hypothetical protein